MLVHSLWDQEDIYGNIALYKALKAQHPDTPICIWCIGPWFHHQERLDGSAIGDIRFGSDTARYFRMHVLRPFLDHYLKDDAPPLGSRRSPPLRPAPIAGSQLPTWPSGCAAGCSIEQQKLYLQPGGALELSTAPRRHAADSMPMCRIRPSRCPICRGPFTSAATRARRAGRPGW